ncbi:hypothetical protein D3C78_1394330 [compost metagenome]
MNTPPYAAYTRPKEGKFWSVGIIPYMIRMMLPMIPYHTGLDSLSHSHTRYPPPISASPAIIKINIEMSMIGPPLSNKSVQSQHIFLFYYTSIRRMFRVSNHGTKFLLDPDISVRV